MADRGWPETRLTVARPETPEGELRTTHVELIERGSEAKVCAEQFEAVMRAWEADENDNDVRGWMDKLLNLAASWREQGR